MGIGLGIVIASLIMLFSQSSYYSDYEIEKKAREMGMKYPEEILAIEKNIEGGNGK